MQNPWNMLWLLLIGIVTATLSTPSQVSAQNDCGKYCGPCMEDSFEGHTYNTEGWYDMACVGGGGCAQLGCGPALVAEDGSEVADLLGQIASTSPEELRGLVEPFASRLLIQPERNLVLIRGTKCDPTALFAVRAITDSQTSALQRLGVASMSSFVKTIVDEEDRWAIPQATLEISGTR